MDQPHIQRMAAAAAVALGTGLVSIPAIIALARRYGLVAKPRADRWSIKPTALLGGIGIFGATIAGLVVGLPEPFTRPGVWLAAFIVFGAGLWDDLKGMRPQYKLLIQILAACVVLAADVRLEPGWHPVFGWAVTLMFVVGVTNALNLLDNMDGLAAGVALVSAGVLAYGAHFTGNASSAIGASALLGASLAFLVFNWHPAKVFMGDCGSMFLGLSLALLAIQTSRAVSGQLAFAVMVPGIALAIPIFDTAFVTVMRKLNGRAISQGGCDHTSHRLVKLGLSEQQAVTLLCGSSLLVGALGVAAMRFRLPGLILAGALLMVLLLLVGKLLAKAEVYEGEAAAASEAVISSARLNKKPFLTVLVDALLALSAGLAGQMAAESVWSPDVGARVAAAIPALVAASSAVLGLTGAYNQPWKEINSRSLLRLAAGAAAGAAASVAGILAAGVDAPKAVAVGAISGLVLLVGLAGLRAGYRSLEAHIAAASSDATGNDSARRLPAGARGSGS